MTGLDGKRRKGFFEGWRDGLLNGWAYDPLAAGGGARLLLRLPGAPEHTIVADRFRADVRLAGFGNGICGFSLPAPAPGPTQAICRWADTGKHLPGSPWRRDSARARRYRAGNISLLLDPPVPGARAFSGAAFDESDPERRLRLALAIDGIIHAHGPATRYAPQHSLAGSDGLHGFRLMIPAPTGTARRIEIREADTDEVLAQVSGRWMRAAGLA